MLTFTDEAEDALAITRWVALRLEMMVPPVTWAQ